MKKTAFITGITGQDGSYLAEFLLKKNYRVAGLIQSTQSTQASYLQPLNNQIHYVMGNLNNPSSIQTAIEQTQPDEVYNLASQSHPGESWNTALETAMTNAIGAQLLFDRVKKIKPSCRIYQASSSEMYGQTTEALLDENTPFHPFNPYAAAKVYAHHMAHIYRKSYGMFISCGILFNHESPRRGMHFITQKITYAVACITLGIKTSPILNERGEPMVKDGILMLGNLDAKRDWGYAGDFVEAMWLMLQQEIADDFIIGTGHIKTIRELCEIAFSYKGLDWMSHVKVDPRLIRPTETGAAAANIYKAQRILNWKPKTSFPGLIRKMVDYHIETLSKEKLGSSLERVFNSFSGCKKNKIE